MRFVNPHLAEHSGETGPQHQTVPVAEPSPLPASPREYDVAVVGAGTTMTLDGFLAATHSTCMLVVVDGVIVTERYFEGVGRSDLLLGASMSKSALATMVGVAVRSGRLSLDDRVARHVPELEDSGYGPCTVRDVITMTSGVDWVEDHRDPDGDARRLVDCFLRGDGGARGLVTAIGARAAPGSRWEYCTADSLALDWVRERATGLDHVAALTELWAALGCEEPAAIMLDAPPGRGGVAMAGGGIAATARDWARLGMLQVDWTFGGERLTDLAWVRASCRPAYPFTRPGRLPSSITAHAGFGYHWWPLDDDGRAVMADGSRGQFTYVDRELRTVVVKTSLWPYDDWLADRQCRDLCYLALPEIARQAAAAGGS